jgi:hypothetical protein
MNALTFNDNYFRLQLLALSLFEWKNLPEGCNARFLEKTLYAYGYGLLFHDANLGFMNSRCTKKGLNYYDEPVAYSAHGTGLQRTNVSTKDAVLIRNNILERPTDESVILFASRLTENQRTIDVNLNALKTPLFLLCDEKDRSTILNIYKKWEGNEPVVIGGKKLNRDIITAIKTDAPFLIDKLDIHDTKLWNDIYTFFGINNANTQKKERLITDEANANNEAVSINAQSMLLTRKEACEDINKLLESYGQPGNVSVEMRDLSQMFSNQDQKEGGEDGELLNRTR